jgi:hypothetical protein
VEIATVLKMAHRKYGQIIWIETKSVSSRKKSNSHKEIIEEETSIKLHSQ